MRRWPPLSAKAVKWGWIGRSPADRASPPPVPHHEIQPPTAEQLGALIAEMDRSDHDRASMVYVAATTGCRRGELCGLRWTDIDFDTASVVVCRSITDTSRGQAAEVMGKLELRQSNTPA